MREVDCEEGVSDGKSTMGGHIAPASVEITPHETVATLNRICRKCSILLRFAPCVMLLKISLKILLSIT